MDAESWFNAKKAVELGFADKILFSYGQGDVTNDAGEGITVSDAEWIRWHMSLWSVVRPLLDMADSFKKKLDKQNSISRQDNLLLAEKLARLQQEKEKCESDRFANADQFMAGQLDKEVYQRRRADLGRLAERFEADIEELEKKLKAAETVKDDSLSQALSVMKRYSGAEELTQAMVQELIDRVIVTDPENVEIIWKFKDEVMKFIGI